MMGADLYFRDKIQVGMLEDNPVLATLLAQHPWFKLCEHPEGCPLLFAPENTFPEIDSQWIQKGALLISCQWDAPYLLVAGINESGLKDLPQKIGNPPSTVIGLALTLKPLIDAFGLEEVQAKALTPLVSDQSEKPALFKILNSSFPLILEIAQGEKDSIHLSVKFKNKPKAEEIIQMWNSYKSDEQRIQLPTAPFHRLIYLEHDFEQQRLSQGEMTLYIGNLRPCPSRDYQFSLYFSHDRLGSLGSAVLNAEVLVAQGKVYW